MVENQVEAPARGAPATIAGEVVTVLDAEDAACAGDDAWLRRASHGWRYDLMTGAVLDAPDH